jgi:hypothetical protein
MHYRDKVVRCLCAFFVRRFSSPCAELFCETWGRNEFDTTWCPTIPGNVRRGVWMINCLRSYGKMAEQNDGTISPVGAVVRHLR